MGLGCSRKLLSFSLFSESNSVINTHVELHMCLSMYMCVHENRTYQLTVNGKISKLFTMRIGRYLTEQLRIQFSIIIYTYIPHECIQAICRTSARKWIFWIGCGGWGWVVKSMVEWVGYMRYEDWNVWRHILILLYNIRYSFLYAYTH